MEAIREAGLAVSQGQLAIPIRDASGTVLFKKYRRAPWNDIGPKYRYDKGSSAALFGLELLNPDVNKVILCEGELDAVALRSHGYFALSSTGGAGTFMPEWAGTLAGRSVTILYDGDRAGVEGAMRVHDLMPMSAIAWIPVQFGKDATDVLVSGGKEALEKAIQTARVYSFPGATEDTKKRIVKLQKLVTVLNEERAEKLRDPVGTPLHQDFALSWVLAQLEAEKKSMKPVRKAYAFEGTEIENAKMYPIRDLIKVSPHGFALCPFHTEKTASFKVYKDHGYCHGTCGKRYDAIDIYQLLNPGTRFEDAVKALTR